MLNKDQEIVYNWYLVNADRYPMTGMYVSELAASLSVEPVAVLQVNKLLSFGVLERPQLPDGKKPLKDKSLPKPKTAKTTKEQ